MEKQLFGIDIELAKRIRAYLGTCPHDQVKDLLAEFDAKGQVFTVKMPDEAAKAKKAGE